MMPGPLAAADVAVPPRLPRWETIDDGTMVHVRWSEPNADGRYLWVRHYASNAWGRHACQRQAEQFNAQGRRPWEWREWTR